MKVKYKLLKPVMGKQVGDVINVDVDAHGTPLDRYIRSYWKDSKLDGCMELVVDEKPKKKVKDNDTD